MKTNRRQYDRSGGPEKFKLVAVNFSVARGSIKTTTTELGITAQLLTRLRKEPLTPKGTLINLGVQLSEEQQELLRLKKRTSAG